MTWFHRVSLCLGVAIFAHKVILASVLYSGASHRVGSIAGTISVVLLTWGIMGITETRA